METSLHEQSEAIIETVNALGASLSLRHAPCYTTQSTQAAQVAVTPRLRAVVRLFRKKKFRRSFYRSLFNLVQFAFIDFYH